jgi:hypothetical protein
MPTKSYELHLPVFKPGDDLAQHLQKNPGKPSQAMVGLAEQYEAAASLCRRVAAVAAETPSVVIQGDTHTITVEGPEAALAGLEADAILTATPWDHEEGDGENAN